MSFVGSVFAKNKAGRALTVNSPGYLQFNTTVFTNNYGGLYVNNGSQLAMTNTTFSGNKALNGAGISINGASWSLQATNTGFNNNFAENKTFPAGAG